MCCHCLLTGFCWYSVLVLVVIVVVVIVVVVVVVVVVSIPRLSGADSIALRGSAVRHHVSDPSDRDIDQAEQPRRYSSTNDDESE